jgi:hypothetical protein
MSSHSGFSRGAMRERRARRRARVADLGVAGPAAGGVGEREFGGELDPAATAGVGA